MLRRNTRRWTPALLPLAIGACATWQHPGESLGVTPRAGGRTLDLGGERRIYLEDRGADRTAPAVLLLHGFASNREVWDGLEPALRARRRTINVDLPGFGASSRLAGDYSPVALAGDLLAVLDALGARRVDVVAHSWGASVAMALALRAPARVRRMVLVGAWVFDEQIPPFFRWARAPGIGEALFTAFYRERTEDRFPAAFHDPSVVSPALFEAIRRAHDRPGTTRAALAVARGMCFLQLEPRYREVRQPVLLLWGREDAVSRLRFGERLEKLLPDARLVTLPGVGHFPMIESPGRTRRIVLRFLESGR